MHTASAGSKESSDCLITVRTAENTKVEVTSIVDPLYHDQIVTLINQILKSSDVPRVHVFCEDRGALDYTIKARLKTALERLGNHAE